MSMQQVAQRLREANHVVVFTGAGVWGWYESRRMQVLHASPNAAHRAIAQLRDHVPSLTVITQNVDDLHERAGSTEVIHLHGSLHTPRCIDCHTPHTQTLELPLQALRYRATVAHINPQPVEVSRDEYVLQGSATQVMTQLLEKAFSMAVFSPETPS